MVDVKALVGDGLVVKVVETTTMVTVVGIVGGGEGDEDNIGK